jgi:hypothetical protein
LNDREIAFEWKHGLTAEDFQGPLSTSLNLTLLSDPHAIQTGRNCIRSAAATATNLALVTGRTIASALQFRVLVFSTRDCLGANNNLPEDVLLIVPSATTEQDTETYWRVPNASQSGIQLRLINPLPPWPPYLTDFIVHELFPPPEDALIRAAEQEMAKRLGKTVPTLNIAYRHALAREVFRFNCHRGVLDYLCPPRSSANPRFSRLPKRESLSYYLHPESVCISDAFRFAQTKIKLAHHDDAQFLRTNIADEEASRYIPARYLREIFAYLRNQIDCAASHEEYGLRYSAYAGLIWEAGLAARRSAEVLPFAFDVSRSDQIAFLADKIRPGSEARFVPLAQPVIEQLDAYVAHESGHIHALSTSYPELKDAIASGRGAALVPTPNQDVQFLGQLIYVSSGTPRTLGTAQIDDMLREAATAIQLPQQYDLSTATLRKNLATFVSEMAPTGMLVEMLLGHNGSQHLFGEASCWIPQRQFDLLRPLLERYLAAIGATPFQSRYAGQSVQKPSVYDIPARHASRFAYEGRALSAEWARARASQAIAQSIQSLDSRQPDTVRITSDQLDVLRKELLSWGSSHEAEHVIAALDGLSTEWNSEQYIAIKPEELLRNIGRIDRTPKDNPSEGHASPLQETNALRKRVTCWLQSNGFSPTGIIEIDDAQFDLLKSECAESLANDPLAQHKLLTEFAALAAKWRRGTRYRVKVAAINLARYRAGPVTLEFARHLALANHIRDSLVDEVAAYLERSVLQDVHRLAAIAVLFVTHEGVLNFSELEPLIAALQATDVDLLCDTVELRARIEGPGSLYDRTLYPGPMTLAAIIGYCRTRAKQAIPFDQVQLEAKALLARTLRGKDPITLRQLTEVMRPFWFLRFPGALYAAAIGQLPSSAETAESTISLLTKTPSVALPVPERKTSKQTKPRNQCSDAITLIQDLLSASGGAQILHKASSRARRHELRKQFKKGVNDDLLRLMIDRPIVDLWVEFLKYMLEEGGEREDILAFNSISTYQSAVLRHLIETGWDQDLRSFDAAAFDAFYETVEGRCNPPGNGDSHKSDRNIAGTVLRLFHTYLRAWHGAPSCTRSPAGVRVKGLPRAIVIPMSHLDLAIETASSALLSGMGSPLERDYAATLIALNSSYMLRTAEGYGIRSYDFSDRQSVCLHVRPNSTRALKTRSRLIPVSLGSEVARRRIKTQRRGLDGQYPRERAALFANPADRAELVPLATLRNVARRAIVSVTNDPCALLYAVRHSGATALAFSLLAPANPYTETFNLIGEILALPTVTREELANLPCNAAAYPFQIDRVGYWMGHSGVDTFMTTYCHCTWLCLSEYAAVLGHERLRLSNRLIALLLGVSTQALSMKRQRMRETLSQQASAEQIIRAYALSNFDAVVNREAAASRKARTKPMQTFLLHAANTILTARHLLDVSLSKAVLVLSDSFSAYAERIPAFLDGYTRVAEQLGIFDFEPASRRPLDQKNFGVDRFEEQRNQFLILLQNRLEEDSSFKNKTGRVLHLWCAGFKRSQFDFLLNDSKDAEFTIRWLIDIGYRTSDLDMHSDQQVLAADADRLSGLGIIITLSDKPLTRTIAIREQQYFGISILRSSKLPTGREFARSMLVAASTQVAELSFHLS